MKKLRTIIKLWAARWQINLSENEVNELALYLAFLRFKKMVSDEQ